MSRLLRLPAAPALLGLSTILAGCWAATISTSIAEPVRPSQLADAGVLAVMPGVVGAGSEWIRPEAMERLVRGLTQRFPGVRIIDPETTGARLAAQSYAAEYASLLADFDRAGVVDPDRLDELLDVVQATHFLHVRTEYSAQRSEEVTSNLDGSPLFYSTKHQVVLVVARLWESGNAPNWEAVVRSESQPGPFSRHRQPSELVESMVSSIIETIPLAGVATADVSPRE